VAGFKGLICFHVPFTVNDTQHCKKLGRYIEDPDKSADEFQTLTLVLHLSWGQSFPFGQQLHSYRKGENSHCCPKEADEAFARNPMSHQSGTDTVPKNKPNWN
jgi:hypothetical protein